MSPRTKMFSNFNFSVKTNQLQISPIQVSRTSVNVYLRKKPYDFIVYSSRSFRHGVFSVLNSKSTSKDYESAVENTEPIAEDQKSILSYALTVDTLLLFGADGVLPELVNGRCAMIGVLSGIVTELLTKTPLTDQFAQNLSNGITFSIIGLVTFSSLLPALILDYRSIADASGSAENLSWSGRGIYKHIYDSRFRGSRAYAVDPGLLDISSLPHIRTPLGNVGFVPFSEIINARFSMALLLIALLLEGVIGHGIFQRIQE